MTSAQQWPALPFEDWAPTKATLHRYSQMVGKIRMALGPSRNHWWHVTLYPGATGLTTGPMPLPDGRSLEIAFDFIDHRLLVTTSLNESRSFELRDGLCCMDFYAQLFGALDELGVAVSIYPVPFDIGGPRLNEDREHDAYDADAVTRYWTVLRRTTDVMNRFAGRFNGKQSPAHLFWHSFDLAQARYSGRPAPIREGADRITVEAYSHEVIAFGFWPGDAKIPSASFYSYTAPAPEGLTERPLAPVGAIWNKDSGTAYLPYDDVKNAADPQSAVMEFFESTYRAGATTAAWDIEAFTASGE